MVGGLTPSSATVALGVRSEVFTVARRVQLIFCSVLLGFTYAIATQ